MGAAPPGLGSGKARRLRKRQGTVGFKLKIPARPQLSRRAPAPAPGAPPRVPSTFGDPYAWGTRQGWAGGCGPDPPRPCSDLGSRATYPARSVQELGAAGSSGPAALLPASRAAPERGGAGAGPDTRPQPRPVPLWDQPREPPPGLAMGQGWRRTPPAPRALRRPPVHRPSPTAPNRRPLRGRERCRGGSPSSPLAPSPGLPTLAREPPGSPDPCLPPPGSHP